MKYKIINNFDNSTITGFKEVYYSKNFKAGKINFKPAYTSFECIIKEIKEIIK